MVDLYVLGATSCAANYMFKKEELAEELFLQRAEEIFTTEKKQIYRSLQIVN
jgi:hypothetical protein